MKAPCCLLGAGALPRPPEPVRAPSRPTRCPGVPRGSCIYLWCVWWMIVVVAAAAAGSDPDCAVRTDAKDVASKAYVSPQVVEGVVQQVDRSAVPGHPYTVTVQVSKKLRAYNGRGRVKKRDIVTLTFRLPPARPDSDTSAGDSQTPDDCLVTASPKPRRKYLFFLSAGNTRGAAPYPVAPPELASKKLRRLVRKTVCKNCGQAPKVSNLWDDSVVENYNLTLECSVEGNPLPEVHWFKDDIPLHNSRKIRIRNKIKRQRRRKIRYSRDVTHPSEEIVRQRGPRRRRLRPRRSELDRRQDQRKEGAGEMGVEGRDGGESGRQRLLTEEEARRRWISGAGVGRRRRRLARGRGRRLAREEAKGRRLKASGKRQTRESTAEATGATRHDRTRGRRQENSTETSKPARVRGRRQDRENSDETTGTPRRHERAGRAGGSGREARRRTGRRGRRPGGTREQRRRTTTPSTTGGVRRRHEGSRNSSTSTSNVSTNRGEGERKTRRRRPPSPQRRVLVSHLVLRNAVADDAGIYKCVAKSVAGEAEAEARIRVVPPIDPHPFVDKCPYDGYCLNGGTCMMFKIVGELVCQCAEGFKGQRCTEKEVYPTFNRNCHGPMRNLRHSQGRRCPRNQPAALWELLQQTLARRHKVSPWTKTQLLSWSAAHTSSAFWPHHPSPVPHSPHQPHLNPQENPGQITTLSPRLMEYLFPDHDFSQVTRRRGPLLGQTLLPTSPSNPSQSSQLPYPDPPHPTFPNNLTHQGGAGSDSIRDLIVNTSLHTLTPQPPDHNQDESLKSRHHTSVHRHRHHHRHHSRAPSSHTTTGDSLATTYPVAEQNHGAEQSQSQWPVEEEPSTLVTQPHYTPHNQQ